MPGMDLRDVRIESADGSVLHHWPIARSEGSELTDIAGGSTGRIDHGIWLESEHSRWRKLARFPVWRYGYRAYDAKRHRLLILEADRLQVYSIEDERLTSIPFSGRRSLQAAFAVYNDVADHLYAYFPGLGPVSRFDETTRTWSHVDSLKSLELNYFAANGFVNALDGSPLSLGGYGWHTVKNHLNRYSYERHRWEIIPLKGDSLLPRAAVIVGNGHESGTYYVFGGYGSESGKQELGFRPLYDLHRLDLRDSTVTSLWTRKDLRTPYWMFGSLVPDEERRELYGIWIPDDSTVSPPTLVRIGIDSAFFEPVADPFPFKTTPRLFFDSDLQELIAVTNVADVDTMAEVYTLGFPPSLAKDVPIVADHNSRFAWLAGGAAFIILGVVGVFRWRRRREARKRSAMVFQGEPHSVVDSMRSGQDAPAPAGARVSLFGKFQVTDAEGRDVTAGFTPRLQQLFLLLLLHTYPSGRMEPGTSVATITATLWPEVDTHSAKNSRGVAMKSLRSLLKATGFIAIEYHHQRYMIVPGRSVSCDYAIYRTIMNRAVGALLQSDDLQMLNRLVGRGQFLEDVHFEWLDAFKTEVMFEVTRLFADHVPESRNLESVEMHVQGLKTVLGWDPLNEQAMQTIVRDLAVLGLHGDAKRTFDKFCTLYRKDIGKPFTKSLKDILGA